MRTLTSRCIFAILVLYSPRFASPQILNGSFDSPAGWTVVSDWPVEFLDGGNPGGRVCILSDCCGGEGSISQAVSLPGSDTQNCKISFQVQWLQTPPKRDHEIHSFVYAKWDGVELDLTWSSGESDWMTAEATVPCGSHELSLGLLQIGGPEPVIPGGPGVCFDNVEAEFSVPTNTSSWGMVKSRY